MTDERDRLEALSSKEFLEYFDDRYNVAEGSRSRYKNLAYTVVPKVLPILEEFVNLQIAYESLVFIDTSRGLDDLEMFDGVQAIMGRTGTLMDRLAGIQDHIQEARRYTRDSERRRFYNELDEIVMRHYTFLQNFHSRLLNRCMGGDLQKRAGDRLEERAEDQ